MIRIELRKIVNRKICAAFFFHFLQANIKIKLADFLRKASIDMNTKNVILKRWPRREFSPGWRRNPRQLERGARRHSRPRRADPRCSLRGSARANMSRRRWPFGEFNGRKSEATDLPLPGQKLRLQVGVIPRWQIRPEILSKNLVSWMTTGRGHWKIIKSQA